MTNLMVNVEKRPDIKQRVYRREPTVVRAAQVKGVSERRCYQVTARHPE